MRIALLIAAILAGSVSVVPAHAAPPALTELIATNSKVSDIEEIGWRRRYYRRYPAPYAYYPPAYGYYYPPPAYGYYAPAYPAYPYAPYRYYRPYYAPYY